MNSLHLQLQRVFLTCSLALGLAACSEPTTVPNSASISLTLVEGQVSWYRVDSQSVVDLRGTVSPLWGDELSTKGDATLQLADHTLIRMKPNTQFRLRRPLSAAERPTLRLLSGAVTVSAQGAGFSVETYREVPLSLRIVVVNVVLEPQSQTSDFEMGFDNDVVKARVNSGEVQVRSADVVGTMLADWRAELIPGDALQIIPPHTPTPLFSPTPTPTLTGTPTPTWTSTATFTPRPTLAPATRTPTQPPPPPTEDQGGGGGAKPTPVPPTSTSAPPTNTPKPPQPTATDAPTSTRTPRDTPAPSPTPGG